MIVQLVVASGSRAGHVVPVSTEKFIIGRATDCHLKARSELISRYHCAILVGSEVVVRDLGSRNGVRLNGEKITTEQTLKNGDNLVLGPLEFHVHIAPDGNTPADTENHSGYHLPSDGGGSGVGPQEPTVVLDNPPVNLNALQQKTE